MFGVRYPENGWGHRLGYNEQIALNRTTGISFDRLRVRTDTIDNYLVIIY